MQSASSSGRLPAAGALLAAGAVACACLCGCLGGCDDVKPRQPSAARSTEAPPPPPDKRDPTKDPSPGDPGWKSSSALGKARDSAVQLKEKIAQQQEEVSKQADEVFKK